MHLPSRNHLSQQSPAALLLDLDDTILDDSSSVGESWSEACAIHAHRLAPLDAATVVDAVRKTSKWFWDDPDRHREGRLQLEAARREVVRLALLELGIDDRDLAACIGDAYSHRRDVRGEARLHRSLAGRTQVVD